MAKHSIRVDLDDETLRDLSELGPPDTVLTRLAYSAAGSARRPDHANRKQTNASLRDERNKSDDAISQERAAIEAVADAVVRLARMRADGVVQTARDAAETARDAAETARAPRPKSGQRPTTAARARTEASARARLEHERAKADAKLMDQRAEKKNQRASVLAVEREATDKDLTGERARIDSLVTDQRDANERLLIATLRAQELAEVAEEAKSRAEQSAIELQEVGKFRDEFMGILGHDLRNPLSSIVMSAQLMLSAGRLATEDAASAARIVRSANRIGRMITQLLDLTRVRLGSGMRIDRKPTDLRAICRDIVAEFAAPIELEFQGDVTGAWDEDRLAEVLSNVLGNAVDYATPGTTVRVRARSTDDHVVVEVSNQGPSIPEDVQSHMFEPFRRGRPAEKSPSGNLGLGLYIAREIVLAHGGTLDAHSAGGTTTFVMHLPRAAPTGT